MNYPEWSSLTLRERLGFALHRYGFLVVLGILFFGSLGLLLVLPGQQQEEIDVEALVAEAERQRQSQTTAVTTTQRPTPLRVTSVPSGAALLLDGDSVGTTPRLVRTKSSTPSSSSSRMTCWLSDG